MQCTPDFFASLKISSIPSAVARSRSCPIFLREASVGNKFTSSAANDRNSTRSLWKCHIDGPRNFGCVPSISIKDRFLYDVSVNQRP